MENENIEYLEMGKYEKEIFQTLRVLLEIEIASDGRDNDPYANAWLTIRQGAAKLIVDTYKDIGEAKILGCLECQASYGVHNK